MWISPFLRLQMWKLQLVEVSLQNIHQSHEQVDCINNCHDFSSLHEYLDLSTLSNCGA